MRKRRKRKERKKKKTLLLTALSNSLLVLLVLVPAVENPVLPTECAHSDILSSALLANYGLRGL